MNRLTPKAYAAVRGLKCYRSGAVFCKQNAIICEWIRKSVKKLAFKMDGPGAAALRNLLRLEILYFEHRWSFGSKCLSPYNSVFFLESLAMQICAKVSPAERSLLSDSPAPALGEVFERVSTSRPPDLLQCQIPRRITFREPTQRQG